MNATLPPFSSRKFAATTGGIAKEPGEKKLSRFVSPERSIELSNSDEHPSPTKLILTENSKKKLPPGYPEHILEGFDEFLRAYDFSKKAFGIPPKEKKNIRVAAKSAQKLRSRAKSSKSKDSIF